MRNESALLAACLKQEVSEEKRGVACYRAWQTKLNYFEFKYRNMG